MKTIFKKYKYAIYAVISLLGSLFINNWMDGRKEKKRLEEVANAGQQVGFFEIQKAASRIADAFGTHPDNQSLTEDEEVAYLYITKYLHSKDKIAIEYEILTGRDYEPDVIKYLTNVQVNKLTKLGYFV